jgi:NAD(P)-dependent dehydrogenase (short-subunit alcohol dehydrogenase family)
MAAAMKWGIVFASTAFPEPDRAIAMAHAAERAGFESLWCPEHVVVAVGEGVTPYGGSADGRMDDEAPGALEESVLPMIPLGRLGDAEHDVGRAVVYLASKDGSYVSGTTLMVDSGFNYLR